MESNGSDWLDRAEAILDQLLEFTAQLAEIEQDPGVDAKALSLACARRLDDLKRLIPQDLQSLLPAQNEMLEKMRELYSRTQVCLDVLENQGNRAAARLQDLNAKKQAVRAYSRQPGGKD